MVPNKIDVPSMFSNVIESPTPAIIEVFPIYPIKWRLIKPTTSAKKLVIIEGKAILKN